MPAPLPHPRISRAYSKALPRFSHGPHHDGLSDTLLPQGCVLGTAPVGMVDRACKQRHGEGEEPPMTQVQLSGHLVVTFSTCDTTVSPELKSPSKLHPRNQSLCLPGICRT